jgi:hypothetical protein
MSESGDPSTWADVSSSTLDSDTPLGYDNRSPMAVTDTGDGFDPDVADQLFERFNFCRLPLLNLHQNGRGNRGVESRQSMERPAPAGLPHAPARYDDLGNLLYDAFSAS